MHLLDILEGKTTVLQDVAKFGDAKDKTKPSSTVAIRRSVVVNDDASTVVLGASVYLRLCDGNGSEAIVTLDGDVAADLADALDQASAIVRREAIVRG